MEENYVSDPQLEAVVVEFFSHFNISPDKIVFSPGEIYKITLLPSEEEMGMFIGRYGQAVDSFQYVLSLMVNQGRELHQRILLDVSGYRDKRFEKIRELVDDICATVARTGKPRSIANLTPTERRFVHLYLAENDRFTSYSQGEGTGRRLFIAPRE